MTELAFTDVFPKADEGQWRKLVDGVLKGGAFEKLVSATYEGVKIEPLYARAAQESPRALRATAGAWAVAQRVDHPEAAKANEIALYDLVNGANALVLTVDGAPGARGFGVKLSSAADVEATLKGVLLDIISLRVDAGNKAAQVAGWFADVVKARGLSAGALDIDFGVDPIGQFARTGGAAENADVMGKSLGALVKSLKGAGFTGRTLLADGRVYHEAGAGEAQELAGVIASALQYLRMLEANGLSLDEARDQIAFLLVADTEEFTNIAKFRALRRLWARIEEACGLAPKPIRIHAETAWRMTSKRDPWVNMLRGTIAVFSAGLGGADAISVLPFTAALGLPDDLARRIARNTQLILLEESNLAKVVDPAAGAGGFETLTTDLSEKAWGIFQATEAAGGFIAALQAGVPQEQIAAIASARAKAIGRRKHSITGTSEFPNVHEAPVDVLIAAPKVLAPAAAGSVLTCKALPCVRDAQAFEALRDRADEVAAKGKRPTVFLANIGPIAAFTARAMFAKNFFEAGGIEALSNDGYADADAVAAAFKASGAKIACICSSDAIYAETAVAAAKALSADGTVYLAGRPGDIEGALKDAGVADFIYAGCDVLAALQAAFAKAV